MRLVSIALLAGALLEAREIKVGVARLDITPAGPIWLSGYAARTKPSEGIAQRLWAKALAIEDGPRGRAVIVTTDLIGLPRAVSDLVAARALKQYGLERSRLLMNSSHTHAGPAVRPNLMTMYFLDQPQMDAVEAYAVKLADSLVTVVGAALGDMHPAKIHSGHGKVAFAANRRNRPTKGAGPIDHDVPVIAVRDLKGKLRAALFGYACHNTTLGGDYYDINGDYAGAAQAELEALQPGATAMFLMLTGADQNPNPRGTLAHVEQHGKALANEVNTVVSGSMKPVAIELRTAQLNVELELAPHDRERFEAELKAGNKFQQSRAREMLKAYDERRAIRRVPYPVQAIRLSRELVLVGMGGEVVVDYGLENKRRYAGYDIITAGYTHDVMSYIPNKRILSEGGYEPDSSMIYYGMPGPYTEEVEDTVFSAIRQVLARVGVKPTARR